MFSIRVFFSLLLLALVTPIADATGSDVNDAPVATGTPASGNTVFNGVEVPPMRELVGEQLDGDISKGYWLVEYFSPYCYHCKILAPILQTAYEFYYTSPPLTHSTSNDASFSRFYDFNFGKLDCVAFGTACADKDIQSFPTLIVSHDGKELKRLVGPESLEQVSKWLEEVLETIKPGSRPKGGIKLPEVGAHEITDHATETIASAVPISSTIVAKVASSKDAPNPLGKSKSLTAETFQQHVTTTLDPWFIKFYTPWCPHCLEMGPSWAQMAKDMKGRLNVGEVNCDVERRLCKDARVKAYPTIFFFRAGERVDYEGLRATGDLINYANKAVETAGGVADVDAAAFKLLEETEEVIFLYFYDHATTKEDFDALERLTLSLVGRAKLVKTKDALLAQRFRISTWPRLLVSRDGKPIYYSALAPRDIRDVRKVLSWMKTVWLPIVPELDATNAREILNKKLVVMAVLTRERADEFAIAKRELKNAAIEWLDRQAQAYQLERQELRDAKQLRIEEAEDRNDQRAMRQAKQIRINMEEVERKQVGFAWVDGISWERWIRQTYGIGVMEDGERVIINDEENRQYWDTTTTGNPIVPSRTSILETLPKIVANPPKIPPKSTASSIEHVYLRVRNLFSGHPLLSLTTLITAAVLLSLWLRRQMRRGRFFGASGSGGGGGGSIGGGGGGGGGGFFHLDMKEGHLLGGTGTANGKVD